MPLTRSTARVLRTPRGMQPAATEIDYESRTPDRFGLVKLLQARQRNNLAIASFGSISAADTIPGLIVDFNFNTGTTSDTTYAMQGPTAVAVAGSSFAGGTTANAAPGDTLTPATAELFFLSPTSTIGSFSFTFTGTLLQNMVLSLASAGQPGATATQTLSYSVNGAPAELLGTIPGTNNNGYTPAGPFALGADANNAASITIIDSFHFDGGTLPSETLIDNVRIDVAPVPEPSTWFGAGLAIVGVAWMQRRRVRTLLRIG